jgi:hypothetical protein
VFPPYLAAAVGHRDALLAGKVTPVTVAAREKLNAKYFGELWRALTDRTASYPLDAIRARWRAATEKDVVGLAADVAAWQNTLWKTARVGSYMRPQGQGYAPNPSRQVAADPVAANSVPLRVTVKPAIGQAEVVLYLTAKEAGTARGKHVVWHRPRFEAPGKPTLLLRDYGSFGPAFEIDYPSVYTGSARYLAAVLEAANNPRMLLKDVAQKRGLDAAFLERWVAVLAVGTPAKNKEPKAVPAVPLQLLEEKSPSNDKAPAVKGWRKKGTDLPVVVTNSSDKLEHIPGRLPGHAVAVHPTPNEFVAVAWKSPVAGSVRVAFRVTHAHPACGNGVAWWLEHRRAGRATILGKGTLDLGKEAKPKPRVVKVEKGDLLVLAVDARDGNHACDLTEIAFTLTEAEKPGRAWDLAKDVADTVHAGNPHADRHGNVGTWSFVRGASPGGAGGTAALIPPDSVLGRWRQAAADPARQSEATNLARQAETLLSGTQPLQKGPNSVLYDNLVAIDSPLFKGVKVVGLARPRTKRTSYGLPKDRFGTGADGKPVDAASLVVPADSVTQVQLPAALLQQHTFVVEGQLSSAPGDRVVLVQVTTAPPGRDARWDGASPVLAASDSDSYKRLLGGYADFRRLFPLFLCFPRVIPNDEVVSLKMFHREDEPLARLFLDAEQARRLDHLWDEHRFISRQAVAENNYLPLFIGFVTQDQPKAMVAYFEGQRPAFKKRADDFLKDEEAAIPKQLKALLDFASRAYRRPLLEKEKDDLLALYRVIRGKKATHEEAFRGVLTRVLVAPAFLFRIEKAPAGEKPAPVNDWELAARLSYFLWSSVPDNELRRLAAAGRLRHPRVLAAQVQRMLTDERLRMLAIEFGTQWIHVRGFDELKEKNEKLFPTFDANLRKAIYEESILFFQDLFQSDQAVTQVLDADYTFLNETLAKHYGIPGVTGPEWRKVEGVRKYGRGGLLGLASVQARQAGASRTSPVLRGNWVVETLLGEKLPRPPPNVPRLPEEEGKGGLTMRQQVEMHARVPACAVCHVRIDPFGFALEKYDSIGRLRAKDLGGLALDTKVKLRDGTTFEGIDGLRNYLLTQKKNVIVRLFCRRLLGYALGRSVTLSDQVLLDEMVAELDRNGGRLSTAVQVIVRSRQFRMIRGSKYTE